MIDDEELETFLRDNALLDTGELEHARELQLQEDRPLYDVLLDHEFVEEQPLVEFVSEALNVDVVDPRDFDPDDDIVDRIPRSIALENWVLPLEIEQTDDRDRLVLAMRNPIDMAAMDAVADHIEVDIRPVLAGPGALKSALRDAYGPEEDDFDLSSMNFSSEVDEQPIFESIEEDEATQFGKPGNPEELFEEPESSVHQAQTVEAHSDELQERIDEIDATLEESSDEVDDRSDAGRETFMGGNDRARLVERIATAADGLSDDDRTHLASHSIREILSAALVAMIDRDLLTIDELLEALESSD